MGPVHWHAMRDCHDTANHQMWIKDSMEWLEEEGNM